MSFKIVDQNVLLDARNDLDRDVKNKWVGTGCSRKILMGIFCQIMQGVI